jgi:hypothetical protein
MRKWIILVAVTLSLGWLWAQVVMADGTGPEQGHLHSILHYRAADGGRQVVSPSTPLPTHERGPSVATNSTSCVQCSTSGDGGLLSLTAGQTIILSVVDQSGSPVRFSNTTPCGSFAAGTGMMLQPGAYQWLVQSAPDGGSDVSYSCCAQTATSSPAGPWLCASPDLR